MTIKQLLNKESKWTKGYLAKNRNGKFTLPNSPDAVKWCLTGAVIKAYPYETRVGAQERIQEAIWKLFPKSYGPKSYGIAQFNDAKHRTFVHIRKVLEVAGV